MSKKFRVDIETWWAGVGAVEYFEMSDDATEKEIADTAKEIFLDYCNYGYSEVTDKRKAKMSRGELLTKNQRDSASDC